MNKLLRFRGGHEPDVNALSAQLDGQLDTAAAVRLDEHVASCEACRAVRDGLRSTRDALRAMPTATPQRSFRLRAADVENASVRSTGTSRLPAWAPAAMAAAAVAIAVVGAYTTLGRSGSSSSSSERAAGRASTAAPGAQSANASKSFADSSAPGPSGGSAPPAAGTPAAAEAATPVASLPQGAADSATFADVTNGPPTVATAPYSGSITPTPGTTGNLQAVRPDDSVRNKSTAAIVLAITW